MLGLINRGRYGSPSAIGNEFQHLITRLQVLFSNVLDQDGNLLVADPNLAVVAVGTSADFRGSTLPTGWLWEDGAQYSRVKYKALFDVLGTTYGVGDGSTTFNVPDARQRFSLGKAASGTGSTLGATGGAIDHTHTGPSHTHSIPTQADHTHSIDDHQHAISSDGAHVHGMSALKSAATSTAGSLEIQAGTGAFMAGANHAHWTQTPGAATIDTDSGGAHTHGGQTDLTSTSANAGGSHDHGAVTGASGTGNTGTANPPFLVANRMIYAGVAA